MLIDVDRRKSSLLKAGGVRVTGLIPKQQAGDMRDGAMKSGERFDCIIMYFLPLLLYVKRLSPPSKLTALSTQLLKSSSDMPCLIFDSIE